MAEMAQAGVLAGCVVLNDLHLANRMREAGCEWVVAREYDLEYQPALKGNADDIYTGWDWWRSRRSRFIDNGLDKRVFVQPLNEQNNPIDGWFYRGILEAAHQDGYKIALFADSHGNPSGGNFESCWKMRVDSRCMAEAAAGGDIYCYHSYGRLDPNTQKETPDPGSAIWYDQAGNEVRRDDMAWKFYGGRYHTAYESFVPPGQRIPVVFGEAGPSDARFVTAQKIIQDLQGYQARLADDPYAKAVCYWAVGEQSPWQFSNFGVALSDIFAWLRTA